ncbi:MAG: GNAT family N-acetyltransferase [Candidatus Azotimanducaceae bacterium]|tara:strand:+ start:555 stop:1028 length:474 start_codon:yes stop_codon:yes gene_type:complete
MNYINTYRPAEPDDYDALLKLLPQLADFDIPVRRFANNLWEGDAQLLKSVLDKETQVTFADVAVDSGNQIAGLILVTMRDEILSHEPSAHLEAIVVSPSARGQGLGRRLLQRAEDRVKELGAKTLTLHVFANNQRARSLYRSHGFDEEMLRCIKWFD